MDWNIELVMTLRALLSAALGAVIGYEREGHGGDAGIKSDLRLDNKFQLCLYLI
ncbi:hypothetical protein [Stygiobacter electus]|uniref:MgtC family protein n=1 Tax=Stygiobacter electus TaxID=3032292 RepID=A0AAE3NZX7_9BACT|nr:hypothetical protein [Stygiobacter electus]MDF1613131.1 hypothetical protein [Stygiobacter electus]